MDVARNNFFVVNNDEVAGGEAIEDFDAEADLFDSVCAICENGGELLCCEGRCKRSFHATTDAGLESNCISLGLTRAVFEETQNYLCPNCLHEKHQCFACGSLGSSDNTGVAEVFQCSDATCRHFYHPKCVAELLYPANEVQASELEMNIASGETFTCPVHRCVVCNQVENTELSDLRFAVCRRCPKSYHKRCLPRDISEGTIQRAWEGLLPGRTLIYCLEHEIDENLGTPIRDHVIFP